MCSWSSVYGEPLTFEDPTYPTTNGWIRPDGSNLYLRVFVPARLDSTLTFA